MAYQQRNLGPGAIGGYSVILNPGCSAGSIVCVSGECWVTLQKVATTGYADGSNVLVTNPSTVGYTSGATRLSSTAPATGALEWGGERIHETNWPDSVSQVNIFCTVASEVQVLAH